MKYKYIKQIIRGAHNDIQHQNNAHPKNCPIDCDGVQLTNAQCHMVPISILWYPESWNKVFRSKHIIQSTGIFDISRMVNSTIFYGNLRLSYIQAFYTQIWNRQRIMPSDCFFIHHNILDVSKMVNVSVVDNLCVAYQCSIGFCKWTWYGSCVLIFRVAWCFILLPNISERCLICHYACLRIIEQSLTTDSCLVRRVQYVWIGQAILILYLFRCKLECSGMINESI